MRAKQKRLILEVDYSTTVDLERALRSVSDAVSKGIMYERKLHANCLIEYSVYRTDFPEFTIQEINGQQCMIFKSKMNNEQI